jgi:hypothetical protein
VASILVGLTITVGRDFTPSMGSSLAVECGRGVFWGVKKGKPEDPKKLRNPPSVAILDQEPDRAAANVRFFLFATPLFHYPVDVRKFISSYLFYLYCLVLLRVARREFVYNRC